MRIWKPVLVLVILASFSGCSKETVEDTSTTTVSPSTPAAPAGSPSSKPSTVASNTSKASSKVDSTAAAPAPVARPSVDIPSGTDVTIILADSLDSGENKAGDQFSGNLGSPVIIGGRTAIEKGARVQGRVVDVESSGRVKGRANIRLVLTGVVHDGKMIPIVTKDKFIEAEATKGRDAAVIGGGAGIGTAIGAIAGGKKGAATGAIIGGAAGTGTVLATKGKEVELPSESKLEFTIDKEFRVSL